MTHIGTISDAAIERNAKRRMLKNAARNAVTVQPSLFARFLAMFH